MGHAQKEISMCLVLQNHPVSFSFCLLVRSRCLCCFLSGNIVWQAHLFITGISVTLKKSLQCAPLSFCVLDKMWLRVRKSSWDCYSNWEQELDTCNRKILWSLQYSALIKARVLWKVLVSCHFSSCLFFLGPPSLLMLKHFGFFGVTQMVLP